MPVSAVTRSHVKARALVAQGLDVIATGAGGDEPSARGDRGFGDDSSGDSYPQRVALLLQNATHIVTTAGPNLSEDSSGGVDPFLYRHMDALRGTTRLRAVVYLSSTGVYGEHDGDWVDEGEEARALPGSAGAARLAAEKQ